MPGSGEARAPRVEAYSFGEIIIDGKRYTSDVIIRPDGVLEN